MELNTLENNMRNKLENRRINPSENAWDKLESKLDSEKQTFKKSYWWMGIAASFLVGILISWFIFSNQGTKKTNYLASVQQEKANTEGKPSLTAKQSKSPEIKSPKVHKAEKEDIKPVTKPSQIAKIKSVPKEVEQKSSKPKSDVEAKNKIKPKALGDLKPVIAENVEKPKSNKKTYQVTDAEIDNLLHKAQLKIRDESALRKNKNVVNASVLLQQVETGKDKPLKKQIFKTLKDGLHKFRVLLASRY